MKKIFSIIIAFWIFFSQSWQILAERSPAQYSWLAKSYENVTKYEFVLDLKWSILDQMLKLNSSRVSILDNENWYSVLKIKNVNKFEEKLVLRLYWKGWDYIDFVNFDVNWKNIKKFNDIELIKQNWKIKAKVVIYVNKTLDYTTYNVLRFWLKSAKYLYFWAKKWKSYKKAKSIKVN